MTEVEKLAHFVTDARFEWLSERAREDLKARVLDSIGCAIGALRAGPIAAVRSLLPAADGSCTLIGVGHGSPEHATLYNGALVRYLDFMDIYMAKRHSGHPSDNFAPVLAAAELMGRSGRELLTALAVAYQVQARLLDEAPVESEGFDHTVQLAYSVAAGVSKALGLDVTRTAHALAIAGASQQGLVITRTGNLSNWKGLAAAHASSSIVQACRLASAGITGPLRVIEGKRGLQDSIAGHFSIRWQTEELERVTRTSLKRYVAEGHAQSAIEGILELKDEHHFAAEDVASISLRTFKQANTIVGTGREAGDKRRVETKEQADHSLPYLVAVALLDGDVGPAQFEPSRIARADVQKLLRKVEVEATWRCSRRYPESVPCELELRLKSGRRLGRKQRDWLGFFARPMPWSEVEAKFHRLAQRDVALPLRTEIVDLVANLERAKLNELARLLGKIRSADDPLAQDSLELARAGE